LREDHFVSCNEPFDITVGYRRSDNDFSRIANTGSASIHLAMSENWLRPPWTEALEGFTLGFVDGCAEYQADGEFPVPGGRLAPEKYSKK